MDFKSYELKKNSANSINDWLHRDAFSPKPVYSWQGN